jgi:hypothetical protein
MLNTEQDAVIARVDQRRTFSPARVVGSKQAPNPFASAALPFPSTIPSTLPSSLSSSSSPVSTSPIGQLWAATRESPVKRFGTPDTEGSLDESNYFLSENAAGAAAADYKAFASAAADYNSGFAARYGSSANLFTTNFYTSNAYANDDGGGDVDALSGSLDYDIARLDLGPDFDGGEDSKLNSNNNGNSSNNNAIPVNNGVRSLKAQSLAALSSYMQSHNKKY